MPTEDPRQVELLARIREGVESALSVIGEIDGVMLDCSKRLRVDPSDDSFTALASGITNLGDLISLVQEIQKGIAHLEVRPVPPDAFSSLEKSTPLFRELHAALEGKDWITLADLIQYELSPLLSEGKKDLAAVLGHLSSP